jgi:hypothetical protein
VGRRPAAFVETPSRSAEFGWEDLLPAGEQLVLRLQRIDLKAPTDVDAALEMAAAVQAQLDELGVGPRGMMQQPLAITSTSAQYVSSSLMLRSFPMALVRRSPPSRKLSLGELLGLSQAKRQVSSKYRLRIATDPPPMNARRFLARLFRRA